MNGGKGPKIGSIVCLKQSLSQYAIYGTIRQSIFGKPNSPLARGIYSEILLVRTGIKTIEQDFVKLTGVHFS